ncbi:hypothetical protein BaRGS_00029586, partial [Batillaria attramentaria]
VLGRIFNPQRPFLKRDGLNGLNGLGLLPCGRPVQLQWLPALIGALGASRCTCGL